MRAHDRAREPRKNSASLSRALSLTRSPSLPPSLPPSLLPAPPSRPLVVSALVLCGCACGALLGTRPGPWGTLFATPCGEQPSKHVTRVKTTARRGASAPTNVKSTISGAHRMLHLRRGGKRPSGKRQSRKRRRSECQQVRSKRRREGEGAKQTNTTNCYTNTRKRQDNFAQITCCACTGGGGTKRAKEQGRPATIRR